jgi:hypothetical protein
MTQQCICNINRHLSLSITDYIDMKPASKKQKTDTLPQCPSFGKIGTFAGFGSNAEDTSGAFASWGTSGSFAP